MEKLTKDAALNCKIIDSVINAYRLVQDRVKKLRELGYVVDQQWVGSGGVGTIRAHHGMKGIQVSSTTAMVRNAPVGLAYVAYPKDDSLAELPVNMDVLMKRLKH
jgi:hypothetical protein